MAKLVTTNAGATLLGTGMSVLAKNLPVSEVRTVPELENIFGKDDRVVAEIRKSMASGFHNEEPIVIAKLESGEELGVADGHTRLMVAKELGLTEVPVVYKIFKSLEEAQQYARDRQFHRRNLSQAEIYGYAANIEALPDTRTGGRATERLADDLGVSASTIEHARTVAKRADEETKKKVRENALTINQAYESVRRKREADEPDGDADEDSDDVSDALDDTGGNPQEVYVHSRDMGERLAPPEESAADSRLAERYQDGFADGFAKGFSEGAYDVYERLLELVRAGKTADEIDGSDLFADFTFLAIAPKLDVPVGRDDILAGYNK